MRLLGAARRRVRGADGGEDGGFALVFVLFVSVMVMIGTAAMLTVTTGAIQPAKRSQDSYAAQAAAQSGIQDWVATLNTYCRNDSIQSCAYLQTAANRTITGSLAGGNQTYTATVLNPTTYLTGNSGAVRVRSTGTAGGSNPVSRTLVADVSGVPSVLRFTYFSNYETLGKSFLDSYYGPRTITLTGDAATAANVPSGSKVTWTGTATAPANGYTDDVCDALYYNDPSNPASLSGQGRATVMANRPGLPAGTNFSEDGYTRTPAQQLLSLVLPSAKTDVAPRNAACEVTFTKGMNFTGPVYSRDALYVSNGTWGGSTGPSFTVPLGETSLPAVSTGWLTTSTPAANGSTPYRSDAQLGGTPSTTSTSTAQLVKPSPQRFTLPSTASPDATCTYTGPTRIKLQTDGTAVVTSPLTAASSDACYTANTTGTGVRAVVPIDSTVLKVDDAAAGAATSAPTFADLPLGAANDITTYSPVRGDAYVDGTLGGSARLSIVAAHDIVVTGDLKTVSGTPGTNSSGEPIWTSGAAIDLVATNNVRLYHPVACATGTATNGYCPNDISGLYTTTQSGTVVTSDGTLRDVHPSLQYCSIVAGAKDCTTDRAATSTPNVEIDAAVVALQGSLITDNFNRGRSLGTALVKGGVYANHRGATGQQWEIPTLTSTRHNSGYKLQVSYLSYEFAGLPFVPVLEAGQSVRPWFVLNVSTGGTP